MSDVAELKPSEPVSVCLREIRKAQPSKEPVISLKLLPLFLLTIQKERGNATVISTVIAALSHARQQKVALMFCACTCKVTLMYGIILCRSSACR